jgi:hypothetical protein
MLTSRAYLEYGHELQQLAGTPWSTRMAAGPAGRPALEIYRGATLIDVMVAQSLAPVLLRGACRVTRHGLMHCVAWGNLSPAEGQIRVEFQTSRLRSRHRKDRRVLAVSAIEIAGHFWIATATGRFDHVTAASTDALWRSAVRTLAADRVA